MTRCDIAEDTEQWRQLVALASMVESSWTMKTVQPEKTLQTVRFVTPMKRKQLETQ